MPVKSIYKFSNPLNSAARIKYILQPLILEERTLRQPYIDLKEEIDSKLKNSSGYLRTLDLYKDMHEKIFNKRHKLKDYDIFLISGVSRNLTPEDNQLNYTPKRIAVDIFSDASMLPIITAEAYKLAAKTYKKRFNASPQINNEIVLAVSPVFLPAVVNYNNKIVELDALFTEEIKDINIQRTASELQGFGTLHWSSATTDEQYSKSGVIENAEFRETIFNPEAAKKFHYTEDPKELEKYCYIIRETVASALKTIIDYANRVYLVSEKGSYAGLQGVLNHLPSEAKEKIILAGGEKGIMRNEDLSKLGIAEKSAVRIWAGLLYDKWQANKKEKQTIQVGLEAFTS